MTMTSHSLDIGDTKIEQSPGLEERLRWDLEKFNSNKASQPNAQFWPLKPNSRRLEI